MATKISTGKALTTSLQDIYEVPDNKRSEWALVYITNTAGSNETITLKYYDSSEDATLTILDGYTLASKEFFKLGGNYHEFIIMDAGDKVQASATSDATILLSVIEHNSVGAN